LCNKRLPLSDKTVSRALTFHPAGFMPALWRPEAMPPYLATLHHWCRSLTLLFLSLLAISPAAADPPGRVGRIASLFGSVHLHRAESGESSAAVLNWPLTSGDVLVDGCRCPRRSTDRLESAPDCLGECSRAGAA
jgi:hypothetical protein